MIELMKTMTFDNGMTYEICDEQARLSISDLQNAVICKITQKGTSYVADKTFDELANAIEKGKSVYAEFSGLFPEYGFKSVSTKMSIFAQDKNDYKYLVAYISVGTSEYEYTIFMISICSDNNVYISSKTYYDNYLVNLEANGNLETSTGTFVSDKTHSEILNAYNLGAYVWFAIPSYNVKIPVVQVTTEYAYATMDVIDNSIMYKFIFTLNNDNTGTILAKAIS